MVKYSCLVFLSRIRKPILPNTDFEGKNFRRRCAFTLLFIVKLAVFGADVAAIVKLMYSDLQNWLRPYSPEENCEHRPRHLFLALAL